MVKGRGKMIYIDNDVIEDLEKEQNMSQTINNLLREFFRKKHLGFMTPEELAKHKKKLLLKLKYEQELKELEDGN